MHATATKIPKSYLKSWMKNIWILFTRNDLYTIDEYDRRWEKNPKEKVKNNIRKTCLAYPPIPPSIKWRSTVFQSPRGPKTSQTFPKGTRLKGQKKHRVGRGVGDLCGLQGWNYANQNPRSSEKSRTGSRVIKPQRMEAGKILETYN